MYGELLRLLKLACYSLSMRTEKKSVFLSFIYQKHVRDVEGNIQEWTTEVPQYNNGDRGQLYGGGTLHNGSSEFASFRRGDHSATVHTDRTIGFCLELEVKM